MPKNRAIAQEQWWKITFVLHVEESSNPFRVSQSAIACGIMELPDAVRNSCCLQATRLNDVSG